MVPCYIEALGTFLAEILRLWLFHGTRESAAESITENEFQAF